MTILLDTMELSAGYSCPASAAQIPDAFVLAKLRQNTPMAPTVLVTDCQNASQPMELNVSVVPVPNLLLVNARLDKLCLNSHKPVHNLLRKNPSILYSYLLILEAQEPLGKLLSSLLSKIRKFERPNYKIVKKVVKILLKRGLISAVLLLNQPLTPATEMTTYAPTQLAMDSYKLLAEDDEYVPAEEVYDPDAVYAVVKTEVALADQMVI